MPVLTAKRIVSKGFLGDGDGYFSDGNGLFG